MRTLLGIMFVVVAASSCGSGDETADRDVVDVVATSLEETGESDPNALQFTSTEASCAAEIIVSDVEASRLEELGLDVDEESGPELSEPPLSSTEGDVVFAAYQECIDLRAQLAGVFASDGSISAEEADCVAGEYIESGVLRDALLSPSFDQALNDRIDAALAEAFSLCAGS